eukprot:gene15006-17744_t
MTFVASITPLAAPTEAQKRKGASRLLSQISSNTANVEESLTRFFGETVQSSKSQEFFSYHIITTLDLLLSQDFINTYIRPGGFSAISQLAHIGAGNVVAFMPDGKIVLSVDKDTYEQIGLQGKPSKFGPKRQHWIITLDVHSRDFTPTSKTYQRIIWCLKDRLSMVHLLCTSVDDKGLVRSIDFPEGVEVDSMTVNGKEQTSAKKRVPLFSKQADNELVEKIDRIEFVQAWNEAIGLLLCGGSLPEDANVCSNWMLDVDTSDIRECYIGTLTGLVLPSRVVDLTRSARQLLKRGLIEWGVIQVHGFVDSPVSWGTNEHGFATNGDNNYSIVILPDDEYWTHAIVGSYDTYS